MTPSVAIIYRLQNYEDGMKRGVPMGHFSRIPLEVRIQIYSLLFSGPYYQMPAPEKGHAYDKTTKPAHLALLRVSKQISEEAMEVFYGSHTFNFHVESLGRRNLRLSRSHPAATFLKNINLHIKASMYPEGFVGTCLYLGSPTRDSFVNICSSGIAKGTCRVILELGPWKNLWRLKQAVLNDIGTMTMFKNVIVEAELVDGWMINFPSGDGHGSTPMSNDERASDWISVPRDGIATALLSNLQPTLGSGTFFQSHSICSISFRPRESMGNAASSNEMASPPGSEERKCLWSWV